jgi:hypothetical protein
LQFKKICGVLGFLGVLGEKAGGARRGGVCAVLGIFGWMLVQSAPNLPPNSGGAVLAAPVEAPKEAGEVAGEEVDHPFVHPWTGGVDGFVQDQVKFGEGVADVA